MKLSFTVIGHPEAQGSTRAFIPKGWKRPITTASSPKQKPWRQEVSRAAIEAAVGEIIDRETPVMLWLKFYLKEPKHKPKRRTRPTTKPDSDKLDRLVRDSLTGIIFEDDAQVCDSFVSKYYGLPERVEITIATADDAAQLLVQSKSRTPELFA